MDQEIRHETDTGEVTTGRDYLAIAACLFGAFFFSQILSISAVAAGKIVFFNMGCTLDGSCNPREFPNFSDTQMFVFALTGGGLATVISLLSLPLCLTGAAISLHFRLHPSLSRNLYTAAGFICAALYSGLLYKYSGDRAGEYKLWICLFAVPASGALACWVVYPMLRRPQIPDVFRDE